MKPIRVLTVCGSLQARSSNQAMLDALSGWSGADVKLVAFRGLRDLPHFDLDLNEGEPPATVRAWRDALRRAEGVYIACPEYGHSLPGALKNAIDWVFGSGELSGKPVAVTAASPGPQRGRLGLGALCQTLGALDAVVLGGEPIALGPALRAASERLLEQLLAAVRRVRAGQPVLPQGVLPGPLEALLAGSALRAPLLARLDDGQRSLSAALSFDACAAELADLLADSVAGAPPAGPLLVLARLDAQLDGEHAALARALLAQVVARVDASPALELVLAALGPRALAQLG